MTSKFQKKKSISSTYKHNHFEFRRVNIYKKFIKFSHAYANILNPNLHFHLLNHPALLLQEKTKAIAQQNIQQAVSQDARLRELNTSPLPNATLDLSGTAPPHELSTLV